MKKVFAILLCLIMSFSSVSALAYFDYNDVDEEYVKITDLLYDLEIMEGFEDGTFKPDDTLTRAEAAAIMVRLTGQKDEAEQGETAFCDVPESHWASGYVNVAEANGIVNGMGDGTFAPEKEVTYHQVVKMLLCVLGYEPAAEANGGWNGGGYLYVASRLGFTKGVPGEADACLTRMTAARLVYNALEIELLDPDSFKYGIYGSGPCFPNYYDEETILSEYLGCELVIGNAVCLGENEIEVTLEETSKTHKEGEVLLLEKGYRDIEFLDGKLVTAWIKETEEKSLFLVGRERKYVG